MWAHSVNRDRLQRVDSSTVPSQWHRADVPPDERFAAERTLHPTEEVEEPDKDYAGTFGERDVGGFNEQEAAQQFEALRRNLTQLSRTRSGDAPAPVRRSSTIRSGLSRTKTKESTLSRTKTKESRISADRPQTQRTRTQSTTDRDTVEEEEEPRSDEVDLEAGPDDEKKDEEGDEDELDLGEFMREGHFERRSDGSSEKKVGVIYKDLTVKGTGATATFARTLPDAIIGTFGPDLYRNLCHFFPVFARKQGNLRTLINGFSGCVRDGEMMLVLGRPGSGCSTFLKAVANNRESYAEVSGEVTYGGIPAEKQKKMYRGEVVSSDGKSIA